LIYAFIVFVTLSYLYFEMSAVSLHPDTARLSFLGQRFGGRFMGSLDGAALNAHFKASCPRSSGCAGSKSL
jgi:hypothetical protein